jgi:hypothetical protein
MSPEPAPAWDPEEEPLTLPGRSRVRLFNRTAAMLLALLLGAIGFYVGVRVEKSQLAGSTSTSLSAAGALAGRAGAPGAVAGTGTPSRFAGGGFASRFAGGGASFGTVSSIDGNTIYVTQPTSGNVVKVKLSSVTKITKNLGVRRSAIRPGDTVVVQGATGTGGTITATSLSDSGARGAGFGGFGGSQSSPGSGGSGSPLSSLFGSGGGGR